MRDEKGEQKCKATAAGLKHTLETFAPAARFATFKLLCAVGCVANLRVRQFDVEAAYLQGKFEGDDGEVYVRPPPDERYFDDRGVPIVWKLLKPLYGKADAGRIWHRTAKKQLVQLQGFKQSEFGPCYFYKKDPDGRRVDLILYVDDCCMADTGGKQANNAFRDRHEHRHARGWRSQDLRFRAYVKAEAETYLSKQLADYSIYDTPLTPQLVKDYEIAARKEHYIDPAFYKNYQSKVGALIYAPPCGRPGESYAIGIEARALTFPTKAMNDHANRVLAYMAQNAVKGLKFKTQGGSAADRLLTATWPYRTRLPASVCDRGGFAHRCRSDLPSRLAGRDGARRGARYADVDNSGAVELSKERQSCQPSRHVDRRDLKLLEYVGHGDIEVRKIDTDDNVANVFTKSLPANVHHKHVMLLVALD
eukprot:308797-Pleurochrysis_carterae.AAC.1